MNDKAALDQGLVGHWKFAGDLADSSGNENHGHNHGVDFYGSGRDGRIATAARFNGNGEYVEVPHDESLRLRTGRLSVAVWVKCDGGARNVPGDILSKYHQGLRKGLNLSIGASSPGYSSIGDVRNVHFGIDDARDGEWIDCGRPWPGNTFISTLVTYKGHLYTGIADAPNAKDACRVLRYAGGTEWEDCGRLGDDPTSLSIHSVIVHKGELYAGTGVWDWTKVWAGKAPHCRVYRYGGGTKWHDCGSVGEAGRACRVMSLASFDGQLYAATDDCRVYRHDGDGKWSHCGQLQDAATKVFAMMSYRGRLYASSNEAVSRYDGGTCWETVSEDLLEQFITQQLHTLQVYEGRLYTGNYPEGTILRYEGGTEWTDRGRVGVDTDRHKINETNDLTVYNGKLYAGVLPKAQVWRYEGHKRWMMLEQLVCNDDWDPADPTGASWNRVPCLTVFQGRLYAGTSTCHGRADADCSSDAGKVFAYEAGKCVSFDDDLGCDWRHVAAVMEADCLKLYVDGKLTATSSGFPDGAYDLCSSVPLRIGLGPQNYFNGFLANLRLYERALTADEVQAIHASG